MVGREEEKDINLSHSKYVWTADITDRQIIPDPNRHPKISPYREGMEQINYCKWSLILIQNRAFIYGGSFSVVCPRIVHRTVAHFPVPCRS